MKKLYFLLFTFLFFTFSYTQTSVFINEIHYDDASGDSGEGIEIAGPAGTNLGTYTLTPYNGNGGAAYSVTALSGIIPNEGSSGYGTLWFPISGLQNGAPDGIALDNNGVLIQFLSYEGSFTAVGGSADGQTSTDIGVAESGSIEGESLQLTGSGTTYENFAWSNSMTSTYGTINTGQTFGAASPSINITSPTDNAVFAPGTTNVNIEWSTQNLNGGETVDVTVNGVTVNNQTSPTSVPTLDGFTYNVTVELVDGGVIASDMISFDVAAYTQVGNINALRALASGTYAELTSEALVSYTRSSRNQKYIQDATGGILIDDAPGTITTTFNEGDGMTGLKGVLTNFNQLIQINPVEDISASSSGNTITPDVVSLSVIAANLNDYESKLVRVNNVTFADGNGINTFSSGTNYVINDGTASTFRTNFSEANYINELIPDSVIDFLAIVGSFNGAAQVTARSLSDLTTLSTLGNSIQGFSLSPNPTSLGYINILSRSNSKMDVKVYDILGKQVINESLENNRLDVSKLTSGVYILKASQDDAISTKKLVIQ
ncbi:T9SS type A sorting domain-containing protein [Hyunsoonleella aestuarii]|uniref:T9SS type A sorting domain-containing protein n=1 Tax=Hyunsoonleella aestuarii TaxID=912802 RepID=A0ABP8EAX8_9FLAO|nr:T9SS type A sorting domain-containing protein [Hyunsoonleella aestuarii]